MRQPQTSVWKALEHWAREHRNPHTADCWETSIEIARQLPPRSQRTCWRPVSRKNLCRHYSSLDIDCWIVRLLSVTSEVLQTSHYWRSWKEWSQSSPPREAHAEQSQPWHLTAAHPELPHISPCRSTLVGPPTWSQSSPQLDSGSRVRRTHPESESSHVHATNAGWLLFPLKQLIQIATRRVRVTIEPCIFHHSSPSLN